MSLQSDKGAKAACSLVQRCPRRHSYSDVYLWYGARLSAALIGYTTDISASAMHADAQQKCREKKGEKKEENRCHVPLPHVLLAGSYARYLQACAYRACISLLRKLTCEYAVRACLSHYEAPATCSRLRS